MSTPGVNPNAAPVLSGSLQSLDLESALMAVQTDRANILETQLKDQLAQVDAKNKQIAKLNAAMSALNNVKTLFKGDAKADTTLLHDRDAPTIQAKQIPANEALAAAGYGESPGLPALKGSQYGPNVQGDTTMGQVEAAITELKGQIDSLSNSQQMDMLRLQSLSNKRNEAFEIMTNFIKKMNDNRSSIVGNMR